MTCDDSAFKAIKFPNIFTAFLLLGVGVVVAWCVGLYERVASGGSSAKPTMNK